MQQRRRGGGGSHLVFIMMGVWMCLLRGGALIKSGCRCHETEPHVSAADYTVTRSITASQDKQDQVSHSSCIPGPVLHYHHHHHHGGMPCIVVNQHLPTLTPLDFRQDERPFSNRAKKKVRVLFIFLN